MTEGETEVWGLPLAPLTQAEVVDQVDAMIERREPTFFITANLHYAMLTATVPGLDAVNRRAAFLVADGAPLVVASRRTAQPVPERVAGSDLIYHLAERAALRGHRIFLLGGAPGIADEAARRLMARYPGLQVVGTLCPTNDELTGPGVAGVIERIRSAQPDLLFVALGQPKGEFWLDRHRESLGVPVAVQVGATLDFVAGQVRRAPRLIQKVGLEWAFRIGTDPRRLGPRYWRDALFLARRLWEERRAQGARRAVATPEPAPAEATSGGVRAAS